jgi:5-deoxy-glucuronate isomerase
VSELLVRPSAVDPDGGGTIVSITPESAGWTYVGFEVVALPAGQALERPAVGRETCLVLLSGHAHVSSEHGEWRDVGGRARPFDGAPVAAYLPPSTAFRVEATTGGAEVAICTAPASTGTAPRVLDAVPTEVRGYGTQERHVHNVLMDEGSAESLLVCEVLTPSGHWSSYPPHKHERDALPEESLLEETYYHRVHPADGFGIQRVYTDDRGLDETMAVADRDVVLVPRGYHTVAAPPGVAVHYLNVMAGPTRSWAFVDDPALAWTRAPGAVTDAAVPDRPSR